MAKMTISENRLQELIQESIYEVLQEAQYNEGLGTLLGNGVRNAKKIPEKLKKSWQGFKDDFNTARNNGPQATGKPRSLAGWYGYAKERYWQKRKDWEDKVDAGGNYARHKYKDRDVVGDEYGQEMANTIRDYDTEAYRQDRLNNWRTQRGLGPQGVQSQGVQPHPDLTQQPNKLQQVRIDRENRAKQALYKSGMIPQGSKGTITGWVRKDGQEPDEKQKKLIDNWKRVKLYESKKNKPQ